MTCQVRKSKTIAALLGLAGLLLLLCMGSPQRASAAACDTTWVGGDGNWNEETNWSDGIPGGDRPNVCVTQNGTYTITVGATFDQPASGANIAHLTLGGTSGTQTIDVRGTNLSGTPVGAAINIGGGTINSHGTLTLRSTDANAGASICTGNPGIDSDGVINFEGLGNRVLQGAIKRSEERRVGKECRSRWSPYH